jgi:hypothetical protein
MPVPGTRNDENGIMMVAGRRGVLVIAAPPRRKVPPLVRGGGDCASPCAGFSEQCAPLPCVLWSTGATHTRWHLAELSILTATIYCLGD